ncbi:hypothetical protein ABZT51_52640 [Streptomyces sp. NPDC005373]|uniref:hypothetical protein n=1 Tax=Streptomyces sp. NPDC005373 TaxID=3156879 RepID=UPI00339EE7BF
MEAQVRDYGFSPAQQDEIWRRWREGQSFSLIGRALGAPMQHARRSLYQSGGVAGARRSGVAHAQYAAQPTADRPDGAIIATTAPKRWEGQSVRTLWRPEQAGPT